MTDDDRGRRETTDDDRGRRELPVLRPTRRWRGVVALSLFAGAVGILGKRPHVLLLAAIGVGFAVYPRLVSSPPDPDLTIERTLTPESPEPGDRVDVSVTVRNDGDRWLPDLRVVDGVPALLPVVDGTPRLATALAPGAEASLEYAIEARRGKHRFEPATVLCRDPSGAVERRATASESTVVDCGSSVSSAVVRDLTRRRPGDLVTDDGGSGVEFHRTRAYRAGDPVNRVDWRRYASTGELTTVEFRQERAVSAVLCVDVGSTGLPEERNVGSSAHATALAVYAADRLAAALVEANHAVGLSTFGSRSCWLSPAVGSAQLDRLHRLLDVHPAFSIASIGPGAGSLAGRPRDGAAAGADLADGEFSNGDLPNEDLADDFPVDDPPDGDRRDTGPGDGTTRSPGVAGSHRKRDPREHSSTTLSDGGAAIRDGSAERRRQAAELRKRLGPNAQVVLLTPLADDGAVDAIRTLETSGHPVSVVSPDVATGETVGDRLAAVERSIRVRKLRRTGIPVIDWRASDELETALAVHGGRRR